MNRTQSNPAKEGPAYGMIRASGWTLALAIAAIAFVMAMTGCNGKEMTAEQWEIQKQRAAQALELAKGSGAIAVLQLSSDGRPGFYASEEFGLKTSANFNATLLFVPGLTGMVDRMQAAMIPPVTE